MKNLTDMLTQKRDEAWGKVAALQSSLMVLLDVISDGVIINKEENKKLLADISKNLPHIKQPDEPDVRAFTNFNYANTYVYFISIIEGFFQDFIFEVMRKYPKKMGNRQMPIQEILALSSREEIIELSIRAYVNELFYKKPKDYLEIACSILSLEKKAISELFDKYIEMKARRDIGVHNNWIVNEIYIGKVAEVGLSAKLNEYRGIDFQYLMESFKVGRELMTSVYQQCLEKY